LIVHINPAHFRRNNSVTRWFRRLLAALALFGAAVLSCGGSGGDEPADTSPQGVCAFYAERDCAGFERCDLRDLKDFFNDVATCRERLAQTCELRLTAPGTTESSSRVVACAKAIAQLSCDQYLDYDRWPEPCSLPAGNLPDGSGCVVSSQCQGGSCALPFAERCGVCKTVSRAGGACMRSDDCLDSMPCVDGVCVPHPKLGEPCSASNDRFCIVGVTCQNLDASGLGTCEKPLSIGAACDPQAATGDQCDYTQGYACDAMTQQCEIAATSRLREIGEKCSESALCQFASYCNGQGVCQAKPREGETCLSGVIDCLEPARCFQGVCVRRQPAACP
jgi:hypothetical protein